MFEDIYEIVAPHMTEREALFVAATLAATPRETALAMLHKLMKEAS